MLHADGRLINQKFSQHNEVTMWPNRKAANHLYKTRSRNESVRHYQQTKAKPAIEPEVWTNLTQFMHPTNRRTEAGKQIACPGDNAYRTNRPYKRVRSQSDHSVSQLTCPHFGQSATGFPPTECTAAAFGFITVPHLFIVNLQYISVDTTILRYIYLTSI